MVYDESKRDVEADERIAEANCSPRAATNDALGTRIKKTFDRRLMPIVFCLYVLSYLDRGNIGNAKTAGAQTDLGLSDSQWSLVLISFYIAYVCFEWTTVLWKIFPAHIYVAALCISFGTAAMCSGAATNLAGLIACRALLGLFEAGLGASAPYFLSLFYRREELGIRVSLVLGTSPLANSFASALAYGIVHIRGSLEPWRYLFILEGAPTVIFSLVVFFFLPDSPALAKFLTEEEKIHAVERLQVRDRTKKNRLNWKQVFAGLSDYQNYVHSAMHFCCNYSFAALSNFLPTIVKGLGYSSINAQGLTAPVYFAAFLCCITSAFVSDRYSKRGYVVAAFASLGTVGYLILTVVRDLNRPGLRYAGIWFAACGIYPALVINVTWVLNNQGGDSKRGAGLAMLAVFGQCSSFVSSTVFPSTDGPFYTKGCAIGCALTGMIVIMSLTLHFLLEHDNRRRDRELGPVDKNTAVDVTDEGDKHRNFRYFT